VGRVLVAGQWGGEEVEEQLWKMILFAREMGG